MYGANLLGGLMKGYAHGKQQGLDREKEKEAFGLKKQLINLQISNAKSKQKELDIKNNLINAFIQNYQQKQQTQTTDTTSAPKDEGADKTRLTQALSDGSMDPMMAALMKDMTDIDFLGAGRLSEQKATNKRLTRQGDERIDLQRKTYERGFSEGVPITVEGEGGSQSVMRVPKYGSQQTFQTRPPEVGRPIMGADAPLWIKPSTGERAPVGMTPNQAMGQGFKRITTGQVDSFKSFTSAETIVAEVENLMSQVFPETESLAGRVMGGGKRKFGQLLQTNTEAQKLYSLIQGTLAPVVRAMGEKGNLSDTDMKRAINLFPELTDDADVAWGKIKQLKDLIGTLKTKSLGGKADSAIPKPQTKADFDALPRGTIYIDPDDGKEYRKP